MPRFVSLVLALVLLAAVPARAAGPAFVLILDATAGMGRLDKIGRASCRERV